MAARFELTTSRQFSSWLAETGASLAVTTYQSGKVILIGSNDKTGRPSVFERTLDRPMGLAFDRGRLAIASLIQITGGSDAGKYLVINDGTAGFSAAHDAVVKLANDAQLHASNFII
jgi:hypothetical protein